MALSDIIDHSSTRSEAAPPLAAASNLILIDNYDSFTWNIYQYLVLEGATVDVYRNDKIELAEIIAKKPTQIVISPGPGHPTTDSGISREVIRHFAGRIPILGICMGLQCIFDVYGGSVASAEEWLHGKTSPLTHDSRGVFEGLSQGLPVTRYHSLAGTHLTLPACLEISSWIEKSDGSRGVIQGVRHRDFTVEGVQFHPESILTADGRAIIRNFLGMQGGTWEENAKKHRYPISDHNSLAKASPIKHNILQQIYDERKLSVASQKLVPGQRLSDLMTAYKLNTAPPQISFTERLRQSPFNVSLMAEIKRASPSKGTFALDISAPVQARNYALAGASVISVLTEPNWFKGHIEDVRQVRQALNGMHNRPAVLRKEFIFDEYQILEARLAGADTILLIIKMLEEPIIKRLYEYSMALGMEPLVEVQNSEEMELALKLGANIIGVNNRNLESFEVDLGTASRLRSMVPKETILCALSGIQSQDDVLACERGGIDAVLVGEAIMRSPDAGVFIHQLCCGRDPPTNVRKPASLLVKICGTRSVQAALRAADAGANFVGMILVPGTKRFVSDETAVAISAALHAHREPTKEPPNRISDIVGQDFFVTATSRLGNERTRLVGVFMNQPLSEILEKQKLFQLDLVQLHGNEPLEWAQLIPVPVIRSFKPGDVGIGLRGFHWLPLLDPGAGTGQILDAAALQDALEGDADLRVILAGGLNPGNVVEAVKTLGKYRDRVIAVDVSSGVEEGGQQSLDKIDAFVKAAKSIL